MLVRQISLRDHRNPPNSFIPILLQTLCRRQKTQPLYNQAIPNSFTKTPGVGAPLLECRGLAAAFAAASTPSNSKWSTHSPPAALHFIFQQLTNPSPNTIDFFPLCFHSLTKPFSRKSFPFTSIQNPRVSPLRRQDAPNIFQTN